MSLRRHVVWLIALLASATGARAAVQETIEVLYPRVPVIIARGEPLELKVRVTSGEMIGGATYRGIQRPPGARAPQGVVPASGASDSEVFTFALDSNTLALGDYGFLLEAYRLSRKPVNAVARARVTIVEKAPLTIVAPARGAAFKEDFEIATQADPECQLAGVSVFKDDTPFFIPEGPSFRRTWEIGGDVPGEHTLTVDAVDARGRHYVTSTTVTILPRITVTGLDPTKVMFVQPQVCMFALGATTDKDDDVDKVEYAMDGQPFAESFAAPWNCTLDARALQDGQHEVSAKAVLKDGKTWLSSPVVFSVVNFIVDPEIAAIRLDEILAEERRSQRRAVTSGDAWKRHLAGKRADAMWERRMMLGLKVMVTLTSTRDPQKALGAACLARDVIFETGLDSMYGSVAATYAKTNGLSLRPLYRGRRFRNFPEGIPFYEYTVWDAIQRGITDEWDERTQRWVRPR